MQNVFYRSQTPFGKTTYGYATAMLVHINVIHDSAADGHDTDQFLIMVVIRGVVINCLLEEVGALGRPGLKGIRWYR